MRTLKNFRSSLNEREIWRNNENVNLFLALLEGDWIQRASLISQNSLVA